MSQVTRILSRMESGDVAAAKELLPLVYDELRKLAAIKLRQEKPGQTLEPTALVHEAFLRLVGSGDVPKWQSRGHFFSAAATAMRRILIESARHKQREIHGGRFQRQDLEADEIASALPCDEWLALDEALTKLSQHDPQKAQLVELRFFAGLTGDQAAQALGISPKTADRYWVFARAWLRREMEGGEPVGEISKKE